MQYSPRDIRFKHYELKTLYCSLYWEALFLKGIINTIMLTSSNRLITVAIGKGDNKANNQAFNINFAIHAIISFCY